MIDIETERIIPVRQVRQHVPSRIPGKRVSPATVWRWMSRKNNPLETIKIGGGRFTSVEAIGRFIERSSQTSAAKPQASRPRVQRAGDELRSLIGSPDSGKKRGDQPGLAQAAGTTHIERAIRNSKISPK
jgi:hypothetical protein